ncbi:protein of unknown function [Candidatus Filomicrobium marinum]|nr:protein of unknown function [Candidatus Filomicrobium marinum]
MKNNVVVMSGERGPMLAHENGT